MKYNNRFEWYERLKEIAYKHNNEFSVRDRDGWTYNWMHESPEQAYYEEFPEHKGGNDECY
jgi:hypothetical protein